MTTLERDVAGADRARPGSLTSDGEQWPSLRILVSGHLLLPASVLTLALLAALVLAILLYLNVGNAKLNMPLLVIAVSLAVVMLIVTMERLRTQLLLPLSLLEETVTQVCQGEPVITPHPPEKSGVLSAMARDIDSLSEELTDIYEDMQVRVARQTARLAQKTTSLQLLYDVSASINQSENVDELLLQFLRVLKGMLNGRSATVHLVGSDEQVRLVGSLDQNDRLMSEEALLPVRLCQCGKALVPGDIICPNDPRECSRRNGRRVFSVEQVERVSVPLWYHGDVLGFYHIYVKRPGIYDGREDVLDILNTVGSHLGMAVAKHRSDKEARRLSVVEERTTLAHELHDSLAQTLASLRFQVRMLEETLEKPGQMGEAQQEVQRIRNGLDEAHMELRELINSFRARVDQGGLLAALEKLVERFQQETGIATFFQQDCRKINMNSSQELQALRIVQESLANIRKHAQAHTVRVLVRCRGKGDYLLLVEDDGVGFEETTSEGNPGEHIGLSIMEERARRVGGRLNIESEPGEGTRVELTIHRAETTPRSVEVD
ncbi:ATP-binding protein [endosymbiont of Ridgeia piscesae]|jgi:two-component system nitrate/nitrite sensor histidine kinase NarX|uniref:Sensor protein n=1 Tax=endosymbiont of Ridgeia piscesae TaxID=54398 RepID=A0A0T5Z7P8_9GAMM|nr:ATP-binding protein [endosymbiont of Ridgeia piscesae]KRT58614.1 two-component system, NarL family, nitrate/nitrite sensor histidine kinase NarX [endosymbiont of Ridgeia piscesae]